MTCASGSWLTTSDRTGPAIRAASQADEIPIEASILAVADAYEAMTSDRVYRLAIGTEKAREELVRWAGKQFSREVVEAFLRAVDRESVAVS